MSYNIGLQYEEKYKYSKKYKNISIESGRGFIWTKIFDVLWFPLALDQIKCKKTETDIDYAFKKLDDMKNKITDFDYNIVKNNLISIKNISVNCPQAYWNIT